jgi:hypothetical protein
MDKISHYWKLYLRSFGIISKSKDKLVGFPETRNFILWQTIAYFLVFLVFLFSAYTHMTDNIEVLEVIKYKDGISYSNIRKMICIPQKIMFNGTDVIITTSDIDRYDNYTVEAINNLDCFIIYSKYKSVTEIIALVFSNIKFGIYVISFIISLYVFELKFINIIDKKQKYDLRALELV